MKGTVVQVYNTDRKSVGFLHLDKVIHSAVVKLKSEVLSEANANSPYVVEFSYANSTQCFGIALSTKHFLSVEEAEQWLVEVYEGYNIVT